MMPRHKTLARAVIVPLLLLLLFSAACSFTIGPASNRITMIKKTQYSRLSPLSVHLDDEEYLKKLQDEDPRTEERLFDHDDWVEFRSEDRKMDDIEDLMLPFVAALVLYVCFVAFVI